MALTKRQLEAIQKLIEKRVGTFVLENIGPEALSPAEIRAIKSMGLIRKNVRNLVADSYTMGKIVSLIHPRTDAKALTYEALEKMVRRNAIPMTAVEKSMVRIAKTQAGEYIKGLKARMLKDLKITALTGEEQVLNAVRNTVAEGIARRTTINEVATSLFDQFDDRSRDWRRVAHTEINNSVQKGIYERIKHESPKGPEQLVFKRPNPDACKYCKKVYLEADGFTPIIFKISELEETNIGKKAADWQATIGGVHPWCACQLSAVPEGYGFELRNVSITSGAEIDDIVHDAMTDSEKEEKVTKRAVLTFQG
jgi:hypothetical protein